MGHVIESALILLVVLIFLNFCSNDQQIRFTVYENAAVGTLIGNLNGNNDRKSTGSPVTFLLVNPPENQIDQTFDIDQISGEIRTKKLLDYEMKKSYIFLAIPTDGSSIGKRISIDILDINDNRPEFSVKSAEIQVSESLKLNSEISLIPAVDLDDGIFGIQKYEIISGDMNQTFGLAYDKDSTSLNSYLNLISNFELDRETVDRYELLIRCYDGGQPSLTDDMLVKISVLDVNDNAPIFEKNEYRAEFSGKIDQKILQIKATDRDIGVNGQILYSLVENHDFVLNFHINKRDGSLRLKNALSIDSIESFDVIVAAKDQGSPSLQSTTLVKLLKRKFDSNILKVKFRNLTVPEDISPGNAITCFEVDLPHGSYNLSLINAEEKFDLKTSTEKSYCIVTSSSLDREKKSAYDPKIMIFDFGANQTYTTSFDLKISDVNDNEPRFASREYETNLQENSAPGTSVFKMAAADPDEGLNGEIFYSIENAGAYLFDIDPNSGLICIKNNYSNNGVVINCDVNSRIELQIKARDTGTPSKFSFSKLSVNILGVNDNAPIFDRPIYNVTIKEDAAVGTCFLQILAVDPDCGINSKITYSVFQNGDSFDQFFSLNSDTGTVCVKNLLDYEIKARYQFTVVAQDGGGLSTYATLVLIIQDVNDNAPIFYSTLYNASLRQNTPFNLPIVTVRATDADSGRYGMVRYRISSETDEIHTFRVDSITGDVFVNTELSPTVYDIHVSAVDGSEVSSLKKALIRVTVIMNDYSSPVFDRRSYKTVVREDTLPGISILQTRAFGLDPLIYALVDGDQSNDFSIDKNSGKISLNNYLNFGRKSSYLLNVRVASGRPPIFNHTQVKIEVEDTNDNRPIFEQQNAILSVAEDFPTMTPIFTFMTYDNDWGNNGDIRYRLLNNEHGQFLLHVVTGELKLAKPLDFERQPNYTLRVLATDNGVPPLSSNATLFLHVADFNDNSPVINYGGRNGTIVFEISENLPLASDVGRLEALDADSGANGRLSYAILEGDQDFLGVYGDSGRIYNRKVIDREANDHFWLKIAVRDSGRPARSTNATVKILIKDMNDNAPNCSDQFFSIDENQPRRKLIGKIEAFDLDQGENARLNFSLMIDENLKDQFEIDQHGNLYSSRPLDRENVQEYAWKVKISDNGQPSLFSTCSIFIRVNDQNDNPPFFILPYKNRLKFGEQMPEKSEVFQTKATDFDRGENGTIKYAIETKSGQMVPFSIDPISGLVISDKLFDSRKDENSYEFDLVAEDNGRPPRKTKKHITIDIVPLPYTTSNSNQSLTFTLAENAPLGVVVGKIDEKSSSSLLNDEKLPDFEYSIVSGNIFGIFDIERSTGTIFLIKNLDYEQQNLHILRVNKRALDSQYFVWPSASDLSVIVRVLDENDNVPIFAENPLIFSLAENSTPGRLVWTLNATDKDSGANGRLIYRILPDPTHATHDSDAGFFDLDHVTGDLYLKKSLDFERSNEHSFVIEAEDQAPDVRKRFVARVTVRVYVTDVNDNAPMFVSQAKAYLFEDEPVGYTVIYIAVFDPDWSENGRVSYELKSGDEGGVFLLNESTGLLTLKRRISRNDPRTYNLLIMSKDHGFPSLSSSQHLLISVLNVRNDAPRFEQSAYKIKILENSPPGTSLLVLKAKGIRSIQNSGILFYISSGHKINGSVKFSLDEKTGQLSTNSKLDREEQQTFVLTVYVHDGEYASKYDVASVIVTLLDENDNSPKISPSSCDPFSVPEGRSFRNLTTVVAVDRDSGQNGEIEYSLEGNPDGKFYINSSSGQLSCRALDRENVSSYDLTILATDKGYPKRLTDRCNLRITVLDDNDNDPIFDRNSYNFVIPENLLTGSNVEKPVSATDSDEGLNGFLTFNILNESSGTFDIDSSSGQIRLIRHLSYGKQQNYSFRVEAVDHGQSKSRRSSAVVFISITDVNNNAPLFTSVPLSFKSDAFVRSGQRIAKVTAKDADGPGPNSDIYYSFVNETENHQQFSINPSTGVISVKRDLNFRPGTVVYLRIFASDKGQPEPLKSMGVVQILVRNSSLSSGTRASQPVVKFDKEKYEVTIVENAGSYKQVIRVGVFAPVKDVEFGIIWGNEDKAFAIEAKTGKIYVSDNKNLKWVPGSIRRLIVQAAANFRPEHGSQANTAYAEVLVYLDDSNDHSPQFVQQRYFTSIREGMPSGTFVAQVMAVDHDSGENAQISYSVVGGNLDSAFRIDIKGVIRTNAQLDREIVDRYILTINAADFGTPVRTSSVILDVQVIDVNDNKPSFPSFSTINLAENAEVGTDVTTIAANDVDTYPPSVYSFTSSGNPGNFFALNSFSGRLILIKPLDHEKQSQYNLEIQASDGLHNTTANLKIEVSDENDNSPVFDQQFYQISIPIGAKVNSNIGRVEAKDSDSGKNAEISFKLFSDDSSSLNLWIDSITGNIYLNSSITSEMQQVSLSEFTVEAKDKGQPPKSSLAAVHVQIVNQLAETRPRFLNATCRFVVREDAPIHSKIGTLTTDLEMSYSQFQIIDEKSVVDNPQDDATFFIDSDGNLILLKNLDRESKSVYQFDVRSLVKMTNQQNNDRALCSVFIEIEDVNDNSPQFDQLFYQTLIDDQFFDQNSEKILNVSLLKITAQDKDTGEGGMIFYELSSGQASDKFRIDPDTGHLIVKNLTSLVREWRAAALAVKLVVRASDRGQPSRSSFTFVEVKVDVRKNRISIFFPLSLYLGRIYENEKPGTNVIFTATALCSEGFNKSMLAYSISGDDAAFFHMDPKSGDLYSAVSFDYEVRTSFNIALNVRDVENRIASTNAQILVKGKDEFAPAFSHQWYEFRVDFQTNVGDMAGAVYATDRDHGLDGQVTFNLKKQNSYFAVSAETGTILVTRSLLFLKKVFDKNFTNLLQDDAKHLLDNQVDFETRRIILRIVAYSGYDPSSGQVNETTAFVTLGDFNLSLHSTGGQITSLTITIISILLVVLVLVVLSIMWRTKCKLDYNNKPNPCRKISYPKGQKSRSSIFGGNRTDLNLDVYHAKILNANDGNARKILQSALNGSSKRKFDKQILDATSSSSQQKDGGGDKVWTSSQISSAASDKFVCECKNLTIRSAKKDRNLTTNSNVSNKSSGRDSVIVDDDEEQIDTEEDEVFRHVTQKICQSTICSSASSSSKQQGRRRFDQPSDSGIHLYPSEHEDLDGSLTSEEFPSARQYLASLGVVRPMSPPTTTTDSEDVRGKSCRRKPPAATKTSCRSTTPRTADVPSKMTPTMNRTTAALENYLDEQDDAASADGVDVRELIYSKISEVLADEKVENLRNLPDVARLEATTTNRNSVKFKMDHQKQNPLMDQREILVLHSRQSSSQSNGGRASVHWSTNRRPSVPAAPSPLPAVVANSPHGKGRSPSNNIFSSSSKKEHAAAKFVFPPTSRTISPLPVPKLCARRRCSNEMSPSQQRSAFAYKMINKVTSEHFDV